MSFLKRTLRNAVSQGVSRGVGNAIGKAVQQVVEPRATEYANKAAQQFDRAASNTTQQTRQTTSELQGAFANLERSMGSYATRMSQNMKICPGCEQPTTADKKFCPNCGTQLPEQTVAQAAVCTQCGTQNTVGTKFCAECGAKLPAAVQEEQIAANRAAAVLAEWDAKLSQYPRWTCGGRDLYIDDCGDGCFRFDVQFQGNTYAARQAVEQYRQILQQNGFRPAGQHPSIEQLFKRINGVVYNVDTEHCFEGDPDCVSIGFCIREPYGGFDYVKPEPKKELGFDDLKKFLRF